MSGDQALAELSGVALARLIKQGDVGVVEVVSAALARAKRVQERHNPFACIAEEHALRVARAADITLRKADSRDLPALFGVPFTVKDLLDTEGITTAYGSRALADNVPDRDVVAVARLRSAGGILLGKTTTPEFATKITTDSELCGVTTNPRDSTLTPGGSSGGAGVVAATGVSPLAVSTDGGGSSRVPAATCGVLGMKVTMGAIPHETWPFHFGNNSSVSMNSRHPEDLVALFNVMSGAHPLDPWSRRSVAPLSISSEKLKALQGKRGLFVPALGGNRADARYLRGAEEALQILRASGCEVDEADDDPSQFDPGIATQMIICNLAARVRQLAPGQQERLGSILQGLLDTTNYTPDGVKVQSDAIERSRTYDRVEQIFTTYDFILSPTLTAPPPPADPQADQRVVIDGERHTIDKWWSHLSLANMTGHPAISVPCGVDANGLPVGLHAIGRWDQEQDLIDLASVLSEAIAPLECVSI